MVSFVRTKFFQYPLVMMLTFLLGRESTVGAGVGYMGHSESINQSISCPGA